jgi:hypothetical protein
VRLMLRLLELLALSRTARLPVGRSALWLALVRVMGLRGALPLTAGLLLLRVMANRGSKPRPEIRTNKAA